MPGIGSGSTDSRHQFLAEMPEAKVSMTSLHCRLVSKHRQVMLTCTPGKTGKVKATDAVSQLVNEANTRACLCYG